MCCALFFAFGLCWLKKSQTERQKKPKGENGYAQETIIWMLQTGGMRRCCNEMGLEKRGCIVIFRLHDTVFYMSLHVRVSLFLLLLCCHCRCLLGTNRTNNWSIGKHFERRRWIYRAVEHTIFCFRCCKCFQSNGYYFAWWLLSGKGLCLRRCGMFSVCKRSCHLFGRVSIIFWWFSSFLWDLCNPLAIFVIF